MAATLFDGLINIDLLTCEPIIPDAGSYVSGGHHLRCYKVLLSAVHLHAVVALNKDNAEEEAADHLCKQHKEQSFGQGQVGEDQAKVPSVVHHHASQLVPSVLLALHSSQYTSGLNLDKLHIHVRVVLQQTGLQTLQAKNINTRFAQLCGTNVLQARCVESVKQFLRLPMQALLFPSCGPNQHAGSKVIP